MRNHTSNQPLSRRVFHRHFVNGHDKVINITLRCNLSINFSLRTLPGYIFFDGLS